MAENSAVTRGNRINTFCIVLLLKNSEPVNWIVQFMDNDLSAADQQPVSQ